MITAHMMLLSLVLAEPTKLTIEGAPYHPTVNVSSADVERARERIRTDPAAKAWFESLVESVEAWDDKDTGWISEVMPSKGACFAYGFTGCPICGSRWGTWGSARASFEKPGHVTCTQGHILPDGDHPDTGTGYVAEDKRIHYFVGSYNAWVVETLTFKIAKPYSNIYLLTDDERAGAMAATILDHIAAIYPSCDKGSWDYPSNPPSGRLNRPWYQVARVLVHYVDIYDRIYDHPALYDASATTGLTRRQNIERNLLINGARYCYDMSIKQGGLHNGEADYLRGVLAVGVVLGIPEYITWPVDGHNGIRAMLANNVDRDGRYFETSAGYGLHTRSLYLTFAEPLINYRGSVFPGGLNLYDDPRFQSFLVLPQMAFVCLGHDVPFGDHHPVRARRVPPYNPTTLFDTRYAEYLATRVSDPAQRASYATLLKRLAERDPKAAERMLEWRIFHKPDAAPAEAPSLSNRVERLLNGSFFFGQKGLAVLRRSDDRFAHAAAVRFGPSLVHGHLDDLNVNYFAHGYEMTYDIGYGLGSTHTQVGWAKQTISHNTVVVDEQSQGGGTFGGSLYHFADLPGLTLADASSTVYAHAGVGTYRRLIALTDCYALDVFRVSGGRQHDLPLHAPATEISIQNLVFDQPRTGSLAGEQYRWGELQLNDGDMKGYPNKPYWNPPPENGYGFLVQPASARPEAYWSATWHLNDEDNTRFVLNALHTDGTEVITATAPGIYPSLPDARHVVRRRTGTDLSSCFVSLWQTATGTMPPAISTIRRIDTGTSLNAKASFALAVSHADGKRDIWAINPTPDATVNARDGDIPVTFRGSYAICRLQGAQLLAAHLLDAKTLEIAGWTITLDSPSRSASITGLPDGAAVGVEATWPDDGRYNSGPLYITNPHYSRTSPYTIDHVAGNRVFLEQTDTILGLGTVHEIPDAITLLTRIPHEYARPVTRRGPTGFFRGKLLRTDDGSAASHIRDVTFGNPMAIRVDSTAGFKTGQPFRYHDVQPGDTATVHHYLALNHLSDNTYQLQTNTDVTLTAPKDRQIQYIDQAGRSQLATNGNIPRTNLPLSGLTTLTLYEPAKSTRPNVLLIVSEDTGPHLGCYGDRNIRTPNLDKLATQGVRWDRAYVATPSCSESRSSILTGLYPHQNGQIGLATHKYATYRAFPNIPGLLKAHGYRTGIIGKLHVNPKSAFDFDFRWNDPKFCSFRRRDVRKIADVAGTFITASDQPFFLMVNYPDAHLPFLEQQEGLPVEPLTAKDVRALPFIGVDTPRVREHVAGYYNCISRLDTGIGMLLDRVADAGKAESTLVIYLGDHGAQFSRGKLTCYESGVRVPLIVRWPGKLKVGQARSELVETVDLLPTILDAVEAEPLSGLPGRSFLPLMQGKRISWRQYAFTEYHSHYPPMFFPQRSARNDRYKLIVSLLQDRPNPVPFICQAHKKVKTYTTDSETAGSGETVRRAYKTWGDAPPMELYDLENDPYEFVNLAGRPEVADVQAKLMTQLRAWQERTRDPLADPDKLAQLSEEHAAAIHADYRANDAFKWKYSQYLSEHGQDER